MIKIIVKESMRLLKRWIMSNWIMKLKNQFLLFILKSLTLYTLKTHFLITTFVMCDAGGGRVVKGDRLRAYWVSPFAGSSPVSRTLINKLFF